MAIPRIVVASTLAILTLLGPTASAVGKAKIDKVVYNPPGKDTGTNTHLNEEILVLRNNGDAPIEIGGWIVESNDKEYTFATGTRIASDSTVILHTGRGSDTKRHKYWDRTNYVYRNKTSGANLWKASGIMLSLHDQCLWIVSSLTPNDGVADC